MSPFPSGTGAVGGFSFPATTTTQSSGGLGGGFGFGGLNTAKTTAATGLTFGRNFTYFDSLFPFFFNKYVHVVTITAEPCLAVARKGTFLLYRQRKNIIILWTFL